jgi:transposase InsO family protein
MRSHTVHHNAPLTPEGRRRLIERCRTRPIAHVAVEVGISRATASKWVNRYRQYGELGLVDRPSTPVRQPTATQGHIIARIESMRREHKWPASRIAFELEQAGTTVSRRTIARLLAQLGLNRRKFIDPNGENNREVRAIVAKHPGHMIHLDVKKAGRIPNGGGWRAHGRNSSEACYRARAFAAALDGAEHRRTKPYTPKHNGKIERYNRILAEEFLYARTWTSETERTDALTTWNQHYNYHRPHGAHGGKPPASRTPQRVNNVLASYS